MEDKDKVSTREYWHTTVYFSSGSPCMLTKQAHVSHINPPVFHYGFSRTKLQFSGSIVNLSQMAKRTS